MKELMEGIYSHFNTVNDLNTALDGNLYPHVAPQTTAFPYGVYAKVSGLHDWDFSDFHEEIQVQFSLYSDDASPVEINTLWGYLKALYDPDDDGNIAVTVSGYDVIQFYRQEDVLLRDEEYRTWAYHVTYSVLIEKSRGR